MIRGMLVSTLILRFSIAFAASFLFGWVRQRMGKPIGFGTFIFLAQGACALALIATNVSSENPLPLLAAIVTGIGPCWAAAVPGARRLRDSSRIETAAAKRDKRMDKTPKSEKPEFQNGYSGRA